jgi:hypothetical protein
MADSQSQVNSRSPNPTQPKPFRRRLSRGCFLRSQVEGLRKAYAEIMLNMAKESAARVLAAERRAAALAGDVAAAKEEGVATLCRLKGIMEDKVRPPPPPYRIDCFGLFACLLVGWMDLLGCVGACFRSSSVVVADNLEFGCAARVFAF